MCARIVKRLWRYVTLGTTDADALRNANHCRDRRSVLADVDLLTEEEAGVKVAEMNRYAGERLDQMLLDRRQPVLAAKILGDGTSDRVKFLGSLGPTVEALAGKEGHRAVRRKVVFSACHECATIRCFSLRSRGIGDAFPVGTFNRNRSEQLGRSGRQESCAVLPASGLLRPSTSSLSPSAESAGAILRGRGRS